MAGRNVLSIDVETFSSVDLASCGSFKYIESPDFEVLLLAFAFDDDVPTVVDIVSGEGVPEEFLDALSDPSVVKTGWNNSFERAVIHRWLGLYCPPEQWEDTMVLAGVCGLPMSLAGAGDALGLAESVAKKKEGRDLIRLFCLPRKPTKTNKSERVTKQNFPQKWEAFVEYNRQDVIAEREIRNKLLQWMPDKTEHDFWCLDARINENGIGIDKLLVEQAIEMGSREKMELTQQAIDLTGINNPDSVAQIKAWLAEQEGLKVMSLNKKTIADVVSQLKTDEAKQFMNLRSALSKTSVRKYDAMFRSTCADGHAKGLFQFYGANRTGRFAGRNIQLQNLPRNYMPDLALARELVRRGDYDTVNVLYDSVSSTLSELIRTALIPEPGQRFVIADFNAIEARVTAWIAGEDWRLRSFRNGEDIYCMSASQMFGVPVEKHGANAELRQKGKIAELACGYGGGVGAMRAFGADKMGMTEESMAETVARWREASPNICKLWKSLEREAIRCVAYHTSTSTPPNFGGIRFDWESGILWMTLPSGRRIAFFNPEYRDSSRRNGKSLSYMGVDQTTKKWTRIETFGGKLVENLVQATARDCLRESMMSLAKAGWDIRGHVHDEIICTEPIGGRSVEEMCEVLGRPLAWAPGLPLSGDGYEFEYYMKQ